MSAAADHAATVRPKYVGPRNIEYANSRETLYVVAVDHPNGPWEAIFCKTEEQARWIVALADRATELEARLERERAARKAVESLNADVVLAKRTNLEALKESERARADAAEARATELERERDEALKDVRDMSTGAWGSSAAMIVALRHRVERAETALAEAVDVAIWMSGSSDFSPGGIAHEGWLKMRPQLHHAMEALPARAALGETAEAQSLDRLMGETAP